MDLHGIGTVRLLNKEFNNYVHDGLLIKKFIDHYKKKNVFDERFFMYSYSVKRFISFLGENIDRLKLLKSIHNDVNIVDIAAFGNHTDTIILLRKEFPKNN